MRASILLALAGAPALALWIAPATLGDPRTVPPAQPPANEIRASSGTGSTGQPGGPQTASRPNQELIAFLRSPFGVVVGAAGVLAAGVAWVGGSVRALDERPEIERASSRRRRKRRREPSNGAQPPPTPVDVRLLAGILSAGCLLLPLVFSIAFEDVFALPKTALLWLLAGVALATLVAAAARGGRPISRSIVDGTLLVFLGLSVVSTILSVDPGHSLVGERLQYQGLISIAAYVVLFVGARFALAEVRHARLLSLALLTSAAIVAFYALGQWFDLDQIWSEL